MLVEPTLYRLTFEDGPLKGASVTVASMSVRETWAYNDKLDEAATAGARYRLIVHTVAPLITAWDLEKAAGEPWPLTLDGVLDLPDDWMGAITRGWLKAINGVSEPDPTGTGPQPEDEDPLASLPIETLGG